MGVEQAAAGGDALAERGGGAWRVAGGGGRGAWGAGKTNVILSAAKDLLFAVPHSLAPARLTTVVGLAHENRDGPSQTWGITLITLKTRISPCGANAPRAKRQSIFL